MALLVTPVGSVLIYLIPLADLLILILGILLFLDRNPFKTMPQIQLPVLSHPFGIPLLIPSLLSGALQRQLTVFFAQHSRVINFSGGILQVGVVIYDLNKNWTFLKIFFHQAL